MNNSQFIIYHNSRCSKSRNALEILQKSNVNLQIKNYLSEGLSIKEIENILDISDFKITDLVRKNEILGPSNSTNEIKNFLASNPKFLQRPIVIKNNTIAIIARPPEKVRGLL